MRALRFTVLLISLLGGCKERQARSGILEVSVTAKGFEPARIEVPASQKVVLRFVRKVAQTCADAVEVQGDPVRHMLPLDTPIDVTVTAPASGELAFACPMNMYRGAIVVVGQ